MLNNLLKAKVVMLATQSKSILWYSGRDKKLYCTIPYYNDGNSSTRQLFITSDREIKEDNWVIYYGKSENYIGQIFTIIKTNSSRPVATLKVNNMDKTVGDVFLDKCKKIESTTDPELPGIHNTGWKSPKLIGKISQVFIQKYVEMYNKGTPIVDVWLDIVNNRWSDIGQHEMEMLDRAGSPYPKNPPSSWYNVSIKTNSSNEVSIHPIKQQFSRDELRKAVFSFGAELWRNEYAQDPETEQTNMTEIFEEWFNKNY